MTKSFYKVINGFYTYVAYHVFRISLGTFVVSNLLPQGAIQTWKPSSPSQAFLALHVSIKFHKVDIVIFHLREPYADLPFCWHDSCYLSCFASWIPVYDVIAFVETSYCIRNLLLFKTLILTSLS